MPLVPADLELFRQYSWPGNIRELAAVLDRAAILGDGKCLEVAKSLGAPAPAGRSAIDERQSANPVAPTTHDSKQEDHSLDEVIRRKIEEVLELTGGRVEGSKGAARLLRVNPHTLRARTRKLGIAWSRFRKPTT